MKTTMSTETFWIKELVIKPGVLRACMTYDLSAHAVLTAVVRHNASYSDHLGEHDGGCLLSVYHTQNSFRFCVMTENNRSVTTVLLPGEDF